MRRPTWPNLVRNCTLVEAVVALSRSFDPDQRWSLILAGRVSQPGSYRTVRSPPRPARRALSSAQPVPLSRSGSASPDSAGSPGPGASIGPACLSHRRSTCRRGNLFHLASCSGPGLLCLMISVVLHLRRNREKIAHAYSKADGLIETATTNTRSAPAPPAPSARRYRFADILLTRSHCATSRSLAPASIRSAASSRDRSAATALRPSARRHPHTS